MPLSGKVTLAIAARNGATWFWNFVPPPRMPSGKWFAPLFSAPLIQPCSPAARRPEVNRAFASPELTLCCQRSTAAIALVFCGCFGELTPALYFACACGDVPASIQFFIAVAGSFTLMGIRTSERQDAAGWTLVFQVGKVKSCCDDSSSKQLYLR